MPDWMIYGANGYTGRLIAREAARRGLKPMPAGRNREAIERLAGELDCPYRVFALGEPAAVASQLHDVKLVLNCAGPFSRTAPTLIAACLAVRAHYLDITGEIDVIEHAAGRDAEARAAGVVVMPAVGFDVVPTDCLAAQLAAELPGATQLTLAIAGSGEFSQGTAKTSLEAVAKGGRARVDGRIVAVPAGTPTRTIPFAAKPREAQRIPWGDVASAFYTTGIPNIETYMAMSPADASRMRFLQRMAPLLKFASVRKLLGWAIERTMHGPDEAELAGGRTFVWGEVRDASGRTATGELVTPNAYRLTVLSAVAVVQRILRGDVPSGFQTPARALGVDFAASLPGVARL